MKPADPSTIDRRHDLDALRAAAMLSGIILHAALAFSPRLWLVQDISQHSAYDLIYTSLHGFRMPLFFLISGFFTAMLWRKRGLKSLLWQRFRRIFLPLLLGCVTIVPVMFWIGEKAIMSGLEKLNQTNSTEDAKTDIWTAVKQGDTGAVKQHIAEGFDLNTLDPKVGQSLLNWAALENQTEIAELLLDNGVDVNIKGSDGSTALHSAAFMGSVETAAMLLQHGADKSIKNNYGQTPSQSLAADRGTTEFITSLLKIDLDQEKVETGRKEIAKLLQEPGTIKEENESNLLDSLLFTIPIFHHLWFLWYLCLLVIGFIVYTAIVNFFHRPESSNKWVTAPLRYLWLIPLTLIPQWFMYSQGFGPDASMGLIPLPHIFLFYALFFYFGALYYDANDRLGQVGNEYWYILPLALFVIFPLGLAFSEGFIKPNDWINPVMHKLIGDALQVSYAWMMTFGCMGLFRKILQKENKTIRYLSDSSYWLYITHLPLVIGLQILIRDWQVPAILKLTLICGAVTGFLLFIYEFMIRYTWLGTLLNGPRKRPV